jgi:hypothetical protein
LFYRRERLYTKEKLEGALILTGTSGYRISRVGKPPAMSPTGPMADILHVTVVVMFVRALEHGHRHIAFSDFMYHNCVQIREKSHILHR